MKTLRAHVKDGKVIVDDSVELPDGTQLHLVVADESDDLTTEEREALHEALRAAWRSVEAGRLVSADDVLAELRAR